MSNKFTGITSAGSAIPVYDKDAHSALSQKLDTTALAPAIEAAVSGKQDAGDYYSASNPSGFISSVPETYLQNSDLTISEGKITEISGIPLSAGDELPEIVTQAANYVSAQSGTWDSVTGKQDAGDYYSASNPSGFIDANALTPYQTIEGMTAYQSVEGMSSYQPSGDYYSASNPSGFLVTDDVTGKMDVSGMTAYQPAGDYQPSGDYYSASNPSGFMTELPASATDAIDTVTANSGTWGGDPLPISARDGLDLEMSGNMLWIGASALNETLSGKQDTLTFEYNEGSAISAINGSALAGGGGGGDVPEGVMVESAVGYNAVNEISGYNGSAIAQYGAEKQWLVHDDTLVHAANSAQYALGVNLSAVAQLLGIDETVLWQSINSDGTSVSSGSYVTLTEDYSNFDRLRIRYRIWSDQSYKYASEEVPCVNGFFTLSHGYINGPTNVSYFNFIYGLSAGDSKLAFTMGHWNKVGTTATANISNLNLLGVTGIGRKN